MKVVYLIIVISIILFIITGCSSDSDNITKIFDLYGRVVDSNGNSLENVSVKIINKNLIEKTNKEGVFKFQNLKRDIYKLKFQKDGFNSVEKQIELSQTLDLKKIKMTFSSLNPENSQETYGNAVVRGSINLHNNAKRVIRTANISSKKRFRESSILSQQKSETKQISDEIIIHFDKKIRAQEIENNKINNYNIVDFIQTQKGQLVKLKVPADKTVAEMINYFKKQTAVDFVEPNYKAFAQAVPDDSYYQRQWNLTASNLEAAWEQKRYSGSVTVAVLDSGLIPQHSDLDNILNGANFIGSENYGDPADYKLVNNNVTDYNTETSHGTHVVGIIGATTNNNKGIAGISWDINIIPIKVLDENAEGSYFDIAQGIYYAVDRGADIINLSLGGAESTTYLQDAVRYAASKGVIMVAAVGNTREAVLYPAAYDETIAVGAIDRDYRAADYSNYGKEVDLAAPGTKIYSTTGYYRNNAFYQNYKNMSGTSMSAAHVSGVAALLLENGFSSENILARLKATAVQIDNSNFVGSGFVDAYGALIGNKLNTIPVKVFAGTIENNDIYIHSDIANLFDMNYYSTFEINNAAERELYIMAWRDVNNNSLVDIGDYFGISTKEELSAAKINNIDLNMYYIAKEASAAALNLNRVKVIVN